MGPPNKGKFQMTKLGIGRGHLKSPQRRGINPRRIQDAFALVGTARKYTGVLKKGGGSGCGGRRRKEGRGKESILSASGRVCAQDNNDPR